MKRLLALFIFVVTAGSVAASVAAAESGNGVATVQFAVSYEAFPGGPTVTCKGQRIVTTGPNASVRDRETCQVTDQSAIPEGTYPIVPLAEFDFPNNIAWISDYEYFVSPGGGFARFAVSGTLVVKNRPDGTQTWQVHATY